MADPFNSPVPGQFSRTIAAVPEKDCRTCRHIRHEKYMFPCYQNWRAERFGEKPCILGSLYERAEFVQLWRTE